MVQSPNDRLDALFEALSQLPVASLNGISASVRTQEGKAQHLDAGTMLKRLSDAAHITCHSPFLIRRIGLISNAGKSLVGAASEQRHFDIAELFAFVHPARFALPTPSGIARAVQVQDIKDGLETPELIWRAARALLTELAGKNYPNVRETAQIATFLESANWPWAKFVLGALEAGGAKADISAFATGLNVWDRLKEWEDDAQRPQPASNPVAGEEAMSVLEKVVGQDAEVRLEQQEYAAQCAEAFAPKNVPREGRVVLAEAGTGLGKTLGYLSPASIWSAKNSGTVWVSTYTKNLQRQLEQETARFFPDPAERRHKIVVRKGRENYICLYNLQERMTSINRGNARGALLAALIVRWVRASKDGDMVGGDFPAWLMTIFSDLSPGGSERALTPQQLGLTDRRGECIFTACPHYRKCFIEKAVRSSRKADIVVANHALVMIQAAMDAALGAPETDEEQSTSGHIRRLVFDEGHHIFDAADSAFSSHLTGMETSELRRWIRGPETRSRRGRSLADRLGDLIGEEHDREEKLLAAIEAKARELPGPGWQRRIQAGMPEGLAEHFLCKVCEQVQARTGETGYTLETDCRPCIEGLPEAAEDFQAALAGLARPMNALSGLLLARLDDEANELDTSERTRIDSVSRSLRRRSEIMVASWCEILSQLRNEKTDGHVDWFAIETAYGREIDVGMHAHWIDPTIPFARTVLEQTDGVLITSATLKDRPPELPDDWQNAEMRTGVAHLPYPVQRYAHPSPFDYSEQARIVVVNDVNRENMDQVAAAYRELFLAANGGALGLFTAISRLRKIYERIVEPLSGNGLALYAQHIDPVDIGTLVDMFRAEKNSCLLGTDAVRDGVDVPGDALRLIVLDRVPWPVPSILERARREKLGGSAWTDMQVRLKLRQAFGRLIRKKTDKGVFVVLDPRLASRFATAFPNDIEIKRVGLVEAIEDIGEFLTPALAANRPTN
ncbi:MAG: ATP-dependent DNA helicase [Hyphomicrobiales bacterium]